ncbi:flavin reductase family protein [Oscillospiraceae bacterium HV4-5-C5C]|nr:flavin reductase family protein [Oscillospiraceae bacterium HV4-5-C5C]
MKENPSAERFQRIAPESIKFNPFELIGENWMLVTAGTPEQANCMTASWGQLGVMWNRPVAELVIRPDRYTREFLDRSPGFSLSFLNRDYRKALNYCGSHSGRDGDKFAACGLTLLSEDQVPYIEQADLILICKKLYRQPYEAAGFVDPDYMRQFYPANDLHIRYVGEITAALLSSQHLSSEAVSE